MGTLSSVLAQHSLVWILREETLGCVDANLDLLFCFETIKLQWNPVNTTTNGP